jgi:hypothetical protein
MAGKYAHLIKLLPKFYGAEAATRQDKINELKQRIELQPDFLRQGAALAKNWVKLRLVKDALKAQLSEVSIQLDAVTQLMDTQFEVESTTAITLEGLGNVRTQLEPYAQVMDPEACRLWCLANGFERKMTLNWQTLNSEMKQRMLDGHDLPDGVKPFALVKPVFTKEK